MLTTNTVVLLKQIIILYELHLTKILFKFKTSVKGIDLSKKGVTYLNVIATRMTEKSTTVKSD